MVCSSYPDITLSREESFGNAGSIQGSPCDVQARHENQPANLAHGSGFQEPLSNDKVQRGDDPAEAQTHKHTCRGRHKNRHVTRLCDKHTYEQNKKSSALNAVEKYLIERILSYNILLQMCTHSVTQVMF